MKKTILASFLLLSFLAAPVLVLGQTRIPFPPTPAASTPEVLPESTVDEVAYFVAQWMWTILLIAAVIVILIGAYYFLTAGGDPERSAKGRNFVLYALIAIVVAGLAYGLVQVARKAAEG